MDADGLWQRRSKSIPVKTLYEWRRQNAMNVGWDEVRIPAPEAPHAGIRTSSQPTTGNAVCHH
ncbi:hypothetical protein [Candidatus Methylobacter favarea]|nr:hypothetical protein [Candidatus Methylobacter favarea]